MAYLKGTASSHADLLSQFASWLATQGWALDASQAEGANWRAHLHKGGDFVHLYSMPSGRPFVFGTQPINYPTITVYLSKNFAGIGQPYTASATGAPVNTEGNVLGAVSGMNNGPQASFHFFANTDDDSYFIVIETIAGVFHHIGFGLTFNKSGGNWTGGAWIFGNESTVWGGDGLNLATPVIPFGVCNTEGRAWVRVNIDTFANWLYIGHAASASGGNCGRGGQSSVNGNTAPTAEVLVNEARTLNVLNSQALAAPILVFGQDASGANFFLGTPPSLYLCDGAPSTYAPGSTYKIGPDDYVVFPRIAVRKTA